tara:strand:+ start:395 stop:712 length:318 start_codon:yes stop_codon:yes gene_type:complete
MGFRDTGKGIPAIHTLNKDFLPSVVDDDLWQLDLSLAFFLGILLLRECIPTAIYVRLHWLQALGTGFDYKGFQVASPKYVKEKQEQQSTASSVQDGFQRPRKCEY